MTRKYELPPADLAGYAAEEKLLKRAAELLIHEYALLQNCKGANIAVLLPSEPGSDEKNWITKKYRSLCEKAMLNALKKGDRAYAVCHSRFSNLIVFDLDDPDSDDLNVIREALDDLGWKYKLFNSGRGYHFWVHFTELPEVLIMKYRSGPNVMKAVGESILARYADRLTDKIDLRGCGPHAIKLPLQYDPYHKKIILPYDDSGSLITDYSDAVAFTSAINRNDSEQLIQLLEKVDLEEWGQYYIDSPPSGTPASSSSCCCSKPPTVHKNLKDYLDTVEVGEGESNDFIFNLVRLCWREGVTEEEILGVVKELYETGKADGRITCNDKLNQWLSKAKSQAKKYYSVVGGAVDHDQPLFYESDLDWLEEFIGRGYDPMMLAVHLYASRLSKEYDYYLARSTAVNWMVTPNQFRWWNTRFIKDGIIEVVKAGERKPPRPGELLKATRYRLLCINEVHGETLDASDPHELLLYYASLQDTETVCTDDILEEKSKNNKNTSILVVAQ